MKTIRLTMAQALVRFLENQYVRFDGAEHRFVRGVMMLPGHGNVVGLGQALQQERKALELYQGKNEQGMIAYIANRMDDLGLKKGMELQLCPRSITVHGGGWRRGAEYYRDWLATWYKPVNSQNKEWFINAFFIHTAASAPADEYISRFPPLIDPATKKVDMKLYFDTIRRQFNRMPDIFHFYCWAYNDKGAHNGEYGQRDYQNLIGSLDHFRQLIAQLKAQKDRKSTRLNSSH